MNIAENIIQIWESDFAESFAKRRQKIKTFEKGSRKLKLLYDLDRSEYQMNEEDFNDPCPFCKVGQKKRKSVVGNNLTYIINLFPYFENHFLSAPPEHRKETHKEDVIEMIDVVNQRGWTGISNMEGAGASILEHIHYHGLKADLPIKDSETATIFQDKYLTIESVFWPSFGIKYSWKSCYGQDKSIDIALKIDHPHNLIIYSDCFFSIPRKSTFSSVLPDYKIGAAEVGGYFVTSIKSTFEEANFDMLNQILQDTTITEKNLQKDIANKIRGEIL